MKAYLIFSIDDNVLNVYGCKMSYTKARELKEKQEDNVSILTDIFIKDIEIDHICSLPTHIQEALNSGNGVYQP